MEKIFYILAPYLANCLEEKIFLIYNYVILLKLVEKWVNILVAIYNTAFFNKADIMQILINTIVCLLFANTAPARILALS